MKTDQKLNMTMLCDFYELTMGNGYLKAGFQDRITYFDVYFRSVPAGGGYAIAAGLDQLIDYIEDLHFAAKDMDYLRRKVDAGVDFLTTQMFFDNGLLYNFLYRMQRAGMDIPVCAGIMPICDARQVARVVKLSGSIMPPRFAAIADRFAGDPQAMTQAGIAFATEQIVDLVANGVGHIHLYTMNKPWIARAIVENLTSINKLEARKDATSAN